MIPHTNNWVPLTIEQIQSNLGEFRNWCLCGGLSLDWLLGKTTRNHADTDIGVFRSDLLDCLQSIGIGRVFLCNLPQGLVKWDGGCVPDEVHDIWITDIDGKHWVLQIMVYDDNGEAVVYRRNHSINWNKSVHTLTVRGVRILNPLITFLFKSNKSHMEAKDTMDIKNLIEAYTHNQDRS